MYRLLSILCVHFFASVSLKAQVNDSCRSDSTYFYVYSDSLPTARTLWAKSYTRFGSNGLPAEKTRYIVDGKLLKPNYRNSYTYTNGYLSYERNESWYEAGSYWINSLETYYTNDDKGRPVDFYYKRPQTGEYETRYKTWYNTRGQDSFSIALEWETDGGQWTNSWKYTSVYDGTGRQTEYNIQYWGGDISGWQNATRHQYVYNAVGQLAERIIFQMRSGKWELYGRYLFTYDDRNRLIESVNQMRFTDWMNAYRETYTYNERGCLSNYHTYMSYDESMQQWTNHYEEQYLFPETTTVADMFKVYPNPASSILHIYTTAETPYSLVDLTGQMVLEGITRKGENSVNIDYLAAGIYILIAPGHTQKIILD